MAAAALLAALLTTGAGEATASVADQSSAAQGRSSARATVGRLVASPDEVAKRGVVEFRGTVESGPRKVRLQKRTADGWLTVDSERTTKRGAFGFMRTLSAQATTTFRFRVQAPRTRIRHKRFGKVVTPTATVTVTVPVTIALENRVLKLVNQERATAGCDPLVSESHLRAAARGHSEDMALNNYFSHDSLDGRTFIDRMNEAGYTGWTGAGENIAMGFTTAESVMDGWMNSEGHRANILNCDFNEIGVGIAADDSGYLWTQDFGRRL